MRRFSNGTTQSVSAKRSDIEHSKVKNRSPQRASAGVGVVLAVRRRKWQSLEVIVFLKLCHPRLGWQ
jgi:hypothetical protein